MPDDSVNNLESHSGAQLVGFAQGFVSQYWLIDPDK